MERYGTWLRANQLVPTQSGRESEKELENLFGSLMQKVWRGLALIQRTRVFGESTQPPLDELSKNIRGIEALVRQAAE